MAHKVVPYLHASHTLCGIRDTYARRCGSRGRPIAPVGAPTHTRPSASVGLGACLGPLFGSSTLLGRSTKPVSSVRCLSAPRTCTTPPAALGLPHARTRASLPETGAPGPPAPRVQWHNLIDNNIDSESHRQNRQSSFDSRPAKPQRRQKQAERRMPREEHPDDISIRY